ncbi:MAG: ComF family protein [Firmicutes bacterium]|nr:ComF family protein [Bacillota bacterium]
MRAAGPYSGALKRAIWKLKYEKRRDLATPLGLLMAGSVEGLGTVDALVPVPLHPRKEAERGFNQSLLLARAVAEEARLGVLAGKLTRVRETLPQNKLNPGRRRQNVEGAFAVAERRVFAGRRILLVDDVLTTGSTAMECSKAIMADGAENVDVLVCAIAGG